MFMYFWKNGRLTFLFLCSSFRWRSRSFRRSWGLTGRWTVACSNSGSRGTLALIENTQTRTTEAGSAPATAPDKVPATCTVLRRGTARRTPTIRGNRKLTSSFTALVLAVTLRSLRRESALPTPSAPGQESAQTSPSTLLARVRWQRPALVHSSRVAPARCLGVAASPPHLLRWIHRTRITSGCSRSTSGRPRSFSCWERPWKRWRWESILRNRRWVPGTRASRSCWRCFRAKVKVRVKVRDTGSGDSGQASSPWRHRRRRRRWRTCMWERYVWVLQGGGFWTFTVFKQ